MLRLLYSSGVFESLKMFASECVGVVVLINLFHESRALRTVLPDGSEFIGCSWNSTFPAIPHNTFLGARHRCEKICSGLSVGTIEAKINKVILRICTSSEVYLTSLIQDKDFVKDLRVLAAVLKIKMPNLHHMHSGELGRLPRLP
jgi:hypothetical protein